MSEQKASEKKSWFKKALDKYDQFCEELGVNQGACRGCVPTVKFDPEKEPAEKAAEKSTEKTE